MNNTETKLNEVCNDYFRSIEKELNKNTVPFGDLQPGYLYHVPKIVSLGSGHTILKRSDRSVISHEPVKAGSIKDFLLKNEDIKITVITRYFGIAAASRIALGSYSPEHGFSWLMDEMIMSLKKQLGFGPEIKNTGDFYAKIKDLREDPDRAAYIVDIESCCVPNINLDILK